jgi:preprotein translocase subunit SecA
VSRAIENAQRKVEGRNFDIRKQLLEFDNVANDQRKVIYEERNRLMEVDDISDSITNIRHEVYEEIINQHLPPGSLEEQWDIPGLEESLENEFGVSLPIAQWMRDDSGLHEEKLRERILVESNKLYSEKTASIGTEVMRHLEKAIMLQIVDTRWKDHLAAMDYLRQSVGLRGYAQKNPKEEYKREAFVLFSDMLQRIKREVIALLSRVRVQTEEEVESLEQQQRQTRNMHYLHPDVRQAEGNKEGEKEGDVAVAQRPVVRRQRKIGRNEACPCGSGKKYKHCHGKLT